MSQPIQRLIRGEAARSRLEFKVSVKNKKTGKWERKTIDPKYQPFLQDFFETLRRDPDQKALWEKLSEEGNAIEVTKKGIFIRDGHKWKNILDSRKITSNLRATVKKALESVTSVVGDLSETGKKLEGAEIPRELLKALDKGTDLVIEVHVAEIKSFVQSHVEKICAVDARIQSVRARTQIDRVVPQEIKAKAEELASASADLVSNMLSIQTFLKDGKGYEAHIWYANHFPAVFQRYCFALQEWQKQDRMLQRMLESNLEFHVDDKHIDEALGFAKMMAFYAEKEHPGQILHADAVEQISIIHDGYVNYFHLAETAEKKTTALLARERNYNAQLLVALNFLRDENFVSTLFGQGWRKAEIDEYRSKLETLLQTSTEYMAHLNRILTFFSAGFVREAMNHYVEKIAVIEGRYVHACNDLVFLQKIAEGRRLGGRGEFEKLRPFQINLNHPNEHLLFLREITEAVELAHSRGVGESLVNETSWNEMATLLEQGVQELLKANTFPSFVELYNSNLTKNLELEQRYRQFVDSYRKNRELFEATMRKHGISDLESAFLFNHYEAIYEALKSWNLRFQRVVDLANGKNYERAMEAYAVLIREDFPMLVDKLKNFNLIRYRLRDQKFSDAFYEYAQFARLPYPVEVFKVLSTDLYFQVARDFHEIVKESQFSSVEIANAKQVVDTAFDANEVSIKNFRNVFRTTESERVSPALKRFAEINNHYANFIRPLKEAELAIASERDAVKKRALFSQFKERMKVFLPRINMLNKEFQRFGGLETLKNNLDEDAQELLKAMREKASYLNGLYEELGFSQHWNPGSVEKILLTGPHSSDKFFSQEIANSGWNPEKIRLLSKWYDSFMQESTPLVQAKRALDADPGNVELQKEFNKAVSKHFPKLDSLSKFFNATFTLERVRQLEQAVRNYIDLKRERGGVRDLEPSLEILEQFSLSGRIQMRDNEIAAVHQTAQEPLSWDPHLFDELVSKTSSLFIVTNETGHSLWEQLLFENGISRQQMIGIVKLHTEYQQALRKLNELERQLEAHPQNLQLRKKIVKEMEEKHSLLMGLEGRYSRVLPDIAGLQIALQQLYSYLSLHENWEGSLEEGQVKALMYRIQSLNVAKAFNEKREFLNDLYSRFVANPIVISR